MPVRARVAYSAQPAAIAVKDATVWIMLPQMAYVAVVPVCLVPLCTFRVDARGGSGLRAVAKCADHLTDAMAVKGWVHHGWR